MSLIERSRWIFEFIKKVPVLQLSLGIILGCILPFYADVIISLVFVLTPHFKIMNGVKSWCTFAIGLFLIGTRILLISSDLPANHVSNWNGRYVELQAVVTGDTVYKTEKCSLVVQVERICIENDCKNAKGLVQTWFPRYPQVRLGDVLDISGMLEKPQSFDEFDYDKFLEQKNVYSVIYRPEFTFEGRRKGFFIFLALIDFREWMIGKINTSLPEPHASLLAGILLGAKRSMPVDFSDALKRTGTTHIIAASGYNVTVVINAIVMVLGFLKRKSRTIISLIFVWVFVIMAGFSPPVVRAGVMGSVALISMMFGMPASIYISVFISGAVMLFIQPSLISSVSFQLSFISTVGLIFLSPALASRLGWLPESIKGAFVTTLSAMIITFPITAINFHQLSIVSPIANCIVLPLIAAVMGGGVILVIVPRFLDVFSTLLDCLIWMPLEFIVKAISLLSGLKFAAIPLTQFSWFLVIIYYLVLAVFVVKNFPSEDSDQSYLKLKE